MNLAPSPNNAKRDGIRVQRQAYPAGVAGVKLSLEKIAQFIREGKADPAVRGWAGDVLIAAGRPQSVFGQCTAILNAFRNQTMYASDPVGTEMNVSAAGTLCLRPGLCVRVFDCDDGTIAIGSALMSVGIPVRVIKQTFGPQDQEHVLLEARDESGDWLAIDPSTDKPVGQKMWASSEFRMDPMNASMIGLTGSPDAEYVGIGSPHAARQIIGVGAVHQGPQLPSAVVVSGNYAQASTDLQNQMLLPLEAGDLYYDATEFSNAVQSYRAAGQAGATSIGPEIDLAGAANVTQPLTQAAWKLNAQLASVSGSDQASADQARAFATQMLSLYQQAIAAGMRGGAGGAVSFPQALGWAMGGGLVAGFAWGWYRSRGSRGRRR